MGGSLKALIDSGAQVSQITISLARKMGLKDQAPEEIVEVRGRWWCPREVYGLCKSNVGYSRDKSI